MSSGHQRRLSHRRGDEEHATIFLCGSFLNQYAPDFFNQLIFYFAHQFSQLSIVTDCLKQKFFIKIFN